MYTIVMQQDKELVTTVKTSIFEKESKVDTIRFLVPPYYDSLDLTSFTVLLKYVTPDRKNLAEELVRQPEFYKGYADYRLKVGTKVTALPGDVDMRLSFVKVEKNENQVGLHTEVLHSGNITITVDPLENLYGFNSEESLEIIDQLAGKVNSKIDALNNIANALDKTKADDIEMIDGKVWAMSNGETIGDPVDVEDFSGNDGVWEEM